MRIAEETIKIPSSCNLQGLRLNRTLLCLSLAYNRIGDAGAAYLAEVCIIWHLLLCKFMQWYVCMQIVCYIYCDEPCFYSLELRSYILWCLLSVLSSQVLGPFALTHEEIVERRRQMSKWNSLVRGTYLPIGICPLTQTCTEWSTCTDKDMIIFLKISLHINTIDNFYSVCTVLLCCLSCLFSITLHYIVRNVCATLKCCMYIVPSV